MGLDDRLSKLERLLRPAGACPQHPRGLIELVAPGAAFIPERCGRCAEAADYIAVVTLRTVTRADLWEGR